MSVLKLFRISPWLWSLLLLLSYACGKREVRPPNIIFVLTDDHRWDALGAMGNPVIQTPNIDSLAHHGLLFRNAYVTTAICAVSRASILTGQYESRHHVNDFNTSMTPEALQQTYPVLLRNAGYQIGFIGKYGVGRPKDQPKEQFDFWECSPKGQPDYELKDENGNYLHHTDKVDRDITRFLHQVDKKKPFCLSVSFKAPHVQDNDPRQFIIHPRYSKYYENVVIPAPKTADPKYWEQFPDFFRTDKNLARARWKPRLSTPELYQENVKNYYRLLTQVDDVVGHMMKQLSELGFDDNTIVIFAGDNGLFLGEHGLTGKWYEYQESIRVPLIVFDPRGENRLNGKVIDRIALNIDVAPTILDYAGVRIPEAMQGVNLLRVADGSADRKNFFYEHTFMGSPGIPKVEGVVSREFSYMKFIEHDYEELYDLTSDPLETNNLAKNTAYRGQLANLRSRYEELKKEVK